VHVVSRLFAFVAELVQNGSSADPAEDQLGRRAACSSVDQSEVRTRHATGVVEIVRLLCFAISLCRERHESGSMQPNS
jgi:hypothetical protein